VGATEAPEITIAGEEIGNQLGPKGCGMLLSMVSGRAVLSWCGIN
jgi:hypothetical protein